MSDALAAIALCGAQRAAALRTLASAANSSHRLALGTAVAAIAHSVGAGEALMRARDLCEDGEWTCWVRANFVGSLRTAQRYVRLAKDWGRTTIDATTVSPEKQLEAMRALRRNLFGPRPRHVVTAAGPERSASAVAKQEATLNAVAAPAACAAVAPPGPRLAVAASSGLRAMAADTLSVGRSVPEAAAVAACITDAADDIDALHLVGTVDARRVYFIEDVAAERVKIGVATDPAERLGQLRAACGADLRFLGHVCGGRAREAALHERFAFQRVRGEWFELTDGLRYAIAGVLADCP